MSRKSDKELYKFIVFLLTSFCSMFWSRENNNWVHICRWMVLLLVFIFWFVWYNYRDVIIEKSVKGIFCIRSLMNCMKKEVKKEYRGNNSSSWIVIE